MRVVVLEAGHIRSNKCTWWKTCCGCSECKDFYSDAATTDRIWREAIAKIESTLKEQASAKAGGGRGGGRGAAVRAARAINHNNATQVGRGGGGEEAIMAVDEEDEDDGGPSLLPRRRQPQRIRA